MKLDDINIRNKRTQQDYDTDLDNNDLSIALVG